MKPLTRIAIYKHQTKLIIYTRHLNEILHNSTCQNLRIRLFHNLLYKSIPELNSYKQSIVIYLFIRNKYVKKYGTCILNPVVLPRSWVVVVLFFCFFVVVFFFFGGGGVQIKSKSGFSEKINVVFFLLYITAKFILFVRN